MAPDARGIFGESLKLGGDKVHGAVVGEFGSLYMGRAEKIPGEMVDFVTGQEGVPESVRQLYSGIILLTVPGKVFH